MGGKAHRATLWERLAACSMDLIQLPSGDRQRKGGAPINDEEQGKPRLHVFDILMLKTASGFESVLVASQDPSDLIDVAVYMQWSLLATCIVDFATH